MTWNAVSDDLPLFCPFYIAAFNIDWAAVEAALRDVAAGRFTTVPPRSDAPASPAHEKSPSGVDPSAPTLQPATPSYNGRAGSCLPSVPGTRIVSSGSSRAPASMQSAAVQSIAVGGSVSRGSPEANGTSITTPTVQVIQLQHEHRLLDIARDRLRLKHYSTRAERAYLGWIERFMMAFRDRHPRDMGAIEVEQFLTVLATHCQVSASTQSLALSALLFLYRDVLGVDLPWLENITRAKVPRRLPVVFTRDEVKSVLNRLDGRDWLMASLLYGTGMRLMACVRLRMKDADFARHEIVIRNGKGAKDRITMLPRTVTDALFEPFRNCLVIRTSRRRRYMLTS